MSDAGLLTTDHSDGVRTITLDDGRVNAFSVPMLEALHSALDEAEEEGSIVVLRGREGIFSAGFDLKSIAERTDEMLGLGARLAERLFSFPRPVVSACTGHGIAMGGFVLLASDLRIGTAGDFNIGLNEVVIGLTIPRFGIALAGHRLSRRWHDRATLTGELFSPEDALAAGFLDRLVEPGAAFEAAISGAVAAARAVNEQAHLGTKLRVRAAALGTMREGLEPGADGSW
jgi:enoyl-CoA hydratase/carnithine racemase